MVAEGGTALEVVVGECAEFSFSIPILALLIELLLMAGDAFERIAGKRVQNSALTLQSRQWPLEGARARGWGAEAPSSQVIWILDNY